MARQQGILDTVIPNATVSPAAGRSNYRRNPTKSLQPWELHEQVPTGTQLELQKAEQNRDTGAEAQLLP